MKNISLENESACAWCHGLLGIHHDVLVILSDEDYAKIQNHGICIPCKELMLVKKNL